MLVLHMVYIFRSVVKRQKVRKEEIRVLRTASASFLSESLGGPSGEIRPADNRDDFNAPAASQ